MKQKLLRNVSVNGEGDRQNILIEGENIAYMGRQVPEFSPAETEEFDFRGRLAVPGLINVHTHLDKAGLSERVINETGSIGEARKKLLACKSTLTAADIKERARKTISESVENGIIAIRTHVDVDPIIGLKGMEAMLELREEMKAVITLQIVAFPQEGITEAAGTYELMEEALRMGADVVGGHLSIAKNFREHSARVFDLAERYGKDVDIHVDYDINRNYDRVSRHEDGIEYPDELGIVAMCEEKMKRGFKGTVVASHLCGLDSVKPDVAKNIVSLIKRAEVAVVALPPNNMYCNGRSDEWNTRRGVTKMKMLLEHGVPVSFGPDNIKDPFNPLGTVDMIQNAVLTAYACHMSSERDYEKLFHMTTLGAADIMKIREYGLLVGNKASIAVIDADSPGKALAEKAGVAALFREGRLMVLNERISRKYF